MACAMKKYPSQNPRDEKRILVLGDSVAFGWGVSQGETFSDRMEPLAATTDRCPMAGD